MLQNGGEHPLPEGWEPDSEGLEVASEEGGAEMHRALWAGEELTWM